MSSLDWVPELATDLDELVPLEDSSRADWDDVVGRVDSRRQLRLARGRPHRRLRLAIVVALVFLLLTGVATATYLLVRGNGGIALGGGSRLLVANPNGPGLRKIAGCAHTTRSCTTFEPAWSPDGKQIAFTEGRYGGPRERSSMSVYVAAANGGTARRLAACGLCGEQWGATLGWSPDGKWLAFSRDTGLSGYESLWIVAAAGGKPRRVTDCHTCADVIPVWSPDGKLLVFQRIGAVGPNGLYTVRPDGSDLKRIANGGAPQWSPDGTRIAFDATRGIEVANVDGSDARLIFAGPSATGPWAPSWSPDGHMLVFFKTPGRPGHFRAEVWRMNADGSDKKRLYRSGCCVMVWAPPIWSPDGQKIAFSASSAGGTFVINADGSDLRRISPDTFYYLAWQGVPQH
jgi:Tol biopolymer transport system component